MQTPPRLCIVQLHHRWDGDVPGAAVIQQTSLGVWLLAQKGSCWHMAGPPPCIGGSWGGDGGGDRAGAPWLKADLSTVLGSVGWYLSQQRWVRELLGGWRTAKRRGAAGGHGAKGQGGGNRAGLRHERGLEKIPSISSGSAHARRLLQSALKCKLRFSIRLEVNFDAKKTAHPHPCAQRRRRGLQGCIPGPPTPPGRWDGAEAAASPLAFCLLAPR